MDHNLNFGKLGWLTVSNFGAIIYTYTSKQGAIMKKALFIILVLISFNSFAKEYDCSGLTWFSPFGKNRYANDVAVIVKGDSIQVNSIGRGGKVGKTYVPSSGPMPYFKAAVYKKTESTTKYGVETERTITATNGHQTVEFSSNILGFGFVHVKNKDGYGFYGQCD